ncbi:amidase family protein [Rhizobium sp. ZW T2_16]|jgi:Asp-tRNA(Asn)/Glu-tRNA(Gln) amidotransferase A subunit family amidase|uniref:amidase family protein n=1 Tax=Rhizobium sp. ZW T2_16 TaxID=3378083 RepID=UPI0038555587
MQTQEPFIDTMFRGLVAIKDNINVEGLRCAWGSKLYLDRIWPADELPVARLRAQGAVILGKANVSEFTLAAAMSTRLHSARTEIRRIRR